MTVKTVTITRMCKEASNHKVIAFLIIFVENELFHSCPLPHKICKMKYTHATQWYEYKPLSPEAVTEDWLLTYFNTITKWKLVQPVCRRHSLSKSISNSICAPLLQRYMDGLDHGKAYSELWLSESSSLALAVQYVRPVWFSNGLRRRPLGLCCGCINEPAG